MAESIKELVKRREEVGNDLDRKLDARDRVRHNKARAKRKEEKADNAKRERELEQRIRELVKNERALTQRIKDLRERKEHLIAKIIRRRKERRERNKINLSYGAPHWGGSEDVLDKYVDPVARRFGLPLTSAKRSATDPLTISNPGSDHSVLATGASAHDFGTFTGANFAFAVAKALGISGYSTGNYNGYYIERGGATFRVQILWAVEGHYNHVHVGVRRV
jgi:hypothetical protein